MPAEGLALLRTAIYRMPVVDMQDRTSNSNGAGTGATDAGADSDTDEEEGRDGQWYGGAVAECVICSDAFEPHDVLHVLPCSHSFHARCAEGATGLHVWPVPSCKPVDI